MTARAQGRSLVSGWLPPSSGCSAGYVEIPIETPIQPKLDVRPFSRVFVAGFVTGGSDEVDGNLETVRLLRSQLRNKGSLRVIDADALQPDRSRRRRERRRPRACRRRAAPAPGGER